jgi:Cu+-exporting ATPase
MVGTGVGAQHGILIKGGDAIERAHSVNAVCFDKTGTLTVGKPSVTDIAIFHTHKHSTRVGAEALDEAKLMWLVGSAEINSEHPLGHSLVVKANELNEEKGGKALIQPKDEHIESGRGLMCTVNGTKVVIGSKKWMEINDLVVDSHCVDRMKHFQGEGKTAICIGVNGTVVSAIGIADTLKPEAKFTIAELRKNGVQVWMITGDAKITALAVAKDLDLGPEHVLAEVLPSDKADKVIELQARGLKVAMIGDGINDAPAIAQADLGVSLGKATEVACEAAHMVLMKADLTDVLVAIHLSKTIFARIRMNFVWAMGYNAVMIPVAAGVLYPWTRVPLPPV